MPVYWYNRGGLQDRGINTKIVAGKKPYFMRYIYPTLMRQYNTYIKNTNKKAIREFRLTTEELMKKEDRTNEENLFVRYYVENMPVGIHDCVMNKICRRFENEFDGFLSKYSDDKFDYTIMKSGRQYSQTQYNGVLGLYNEYIKMAEEYSKRTNMMVIDEYDAVVQRNIFFNEFKRACFEVCSDETTLCDIILDICYSKEYSKQFAWDMSADVIIENLLAKNDMQISYPVKDPSGDVEFSGDRFSFNTKRVGGVDIEHST